MQSYTAKTQSLFYLTCLIVVLTFPLLVVGGLVTSTGSGMIDKTWKFTPFMLFTEDGWNQIKNNVPMAIEHGHRQIGFIVGIIALLMVAVGFFDSKRSLKTSFIVLILVGAQGLLGAGRIIFNDYPGMFGEKLGREIALIHGFIGQLAFAMTVMAAVSFTKAWRMRTPVEAEGHKRLTKLCKMTFIFFVVQLMLAVFVRHIGGLTLVLVHAVMAMAILAHALLAGMECIGQKLPLLKNPATLVAGSAIIMVLLGFATWFVGGGQGPLNEYSSKDSHDWRMILSTIHQSLGAIALTASLVLLARARHHLIEKPSAA